VLMRLGAGQDRGIVEARCCVMAVMHRLEALRILEAKLTAIEQDHEAELAENEDLRETVDAKAEARALAAVFDLLKKCKIAHTDSLLRIFKRYLRPKSRSHTPIARQQRPPSRGRPRADSI